MMLDTTTYLLTQRSQSGPILRPEEPPLFDQRGTADDRPMTRGRLIGGLISLAGAGLYLVLTL